MTRRILASCVILVLGTNLGAQEPKEQPAEEAKRELATWLARKDLASVVRGSVRQLFSNLTDNTVGRQFRDGHADVEITRLRNDSGLTDWQPSEGEQLIGTLSAAQDLLVAMTEARDFAKRRAEQQKSNKPNNPAPAKSNRSTTSPLPARCGASDLARCRQNIVTGSRGAFDRRVMGEIAQALERDFKESWSEVERRFQKVFDELLPVMVADGHVRSFETDSLIKGWRRLETRTAPAIKLSDFKDPAGIREVVYEIVDAYEMKRQGVVAVVTDQRDGWRLSKDNDTKGGFYELTAIETTP